MPRIPTSVKSPTFKSFKQVIAMSGSLVSCGGSLAGGAAPREQDEKVDQLLFVADWRRCLQCFFFALLSVLQTTNDWSPICGGSLGEGTGGRGGEK